MKYGITTRTVQDRAGFCGLYGQNRGLVVNLQAQRDKVRTGSRLEHLETLFKEFRRNRAKIEAKQEQD